eukprot:151350-Alexandrium_andersonii.AAC.1
MIVHKWPWLEARDRLLAPMPCAAACVDQPLPKQPRFKVPPVGIGGCVVGSPHWAAGCTLLAFWLEEQTPVA